MDSNKRPTDTNDGSSNSEEQELPNQPPGRTSENSESVVNESIHNEETVTGSGTINRNTLEGRKPHNLKQDVHSPVHPSLKAGTAAFANSNSVGMVANEVSTLGSPNIPLRDILEGGMNLGDSHLTYHSTLPKRKQKRPRIPAEQDIVHMSPKNSLNLVPNSLTLGDTNQYSVPKTTPRILQENTEVDDSPVTDITGINSSGSSMPPVSETLLNSSSKPRNEVNPEREIHESPNNNFSPNSSPGNFVEGLSGRVSFLSKQNNSLKGGLEGGSSAVNMSKRVKQAGIPKQLVSKDLTNVYKSIVKKTTFKEMQINHSERLSANDSKQSNPKYHNKEITRLHTQDGSYLDQTDPKSPLIDLFCTVNHKMPEETTRELLEMNDHNTSQAQLPKRDQFELKSSPEIMPLQSTNPITTDFTNVLVVELPPFEKSERDDLYELCQKLKNDATPSSFHASEVTADALTNDWKLSSVDQQQLNQKSNSDHEELAVSRTSVQKQPSQHGKNQDPKNVSANQNDDPILNVAVSDQTTGQKENVLKKKRKKKEETITNMELTEQDVLSKGLLSNTDGMTPSLSNNIEESNQGFRKTKVIHDQKKESRQSKIHADNQGGTSSHLDSLITTSSSIIDLPVPDHMNK